MTKLTILFLLFFQYSSSGQSLFKSFFQLSRPEKGWTITHLFKAGRAHRITAEVRKKTTEMLQSKVLDTFPHGGKLDAFRHSFWMASLSISIGENASRKLGNAHEKGNYIAFKKKKSEDGSIQDATAVEMDLYNNEEGLKIAREYAIDKKQSLSDLITQAIHAGRMKIMKRDQSGQLCDCRGNAIPIKTRQLSDWKLPYCLVPSHP